MELTVGIAVIALVIVLAWAWERCSSLREGNFSAVTALSYYNHPARVGYCWPGDGISHSGGCTTAGMLAL